MVLAEADSSGSGDELGSLAGTLATKRRRAASALNALTAAKNEFNELDYSGLGRSRPLMMKFG